MNATGTHRQQCAAITNGCMSAIVWEGRNSEEERYRFLTLKGWSLDHGKWVCPMHTVHHAGATS